MGYTAWSVVFGEQPTAAKWNQLGENDAGFKDGTNMDDDFLAARHVPDGLITPAMKAAHIKAGSFTIAATGNKAITGVGFTPKLVQFIDQYSGGSNYAGLGLMTADYQAAKAQGSRAGQSDVEESYFSESYAYYAMTISGTPSLRARFSRVSLDADGFTINVATADATYGVTYVAFG